jgi:hypothetical protein
LGLEWSARAREDFKTGLRGLPFLEAAVRREMGDRTERRFRTVRMGSATHADQGSAYAIPANPENSVMWK